MAVALWGSVWAHELGHVVCTRLGGGRVSAVGLGLEPIWFVRTIGGVRVYVGRRSMGQGLTHSWWPQIFAPRGGSLLSLAGGILANAAVAAGAWGLYRAGGELFWVELAVFNVVLVGMSVVPYHFSIGGRRSPNDGAMMLATLSDARGPSDPLAELQGYEVLQRLYVAIGDTLQSYQLHLHAAQAWTSLRIRSRALEHLAAADALAEGQPMSLQGLRHLVAASMASDEEEREAALAEAERCYAGNPAGTEMVSLHRAWQWLGREETERVLAFLDAPGSPALERSREDLSLALLAQAGRGQEALLARAQAATGLDAIQAWTWVAWSRTNAGEPEAATDAAARGLGAAAELCATLPEAVRAEFDAGLAELRAYRGA